MDWQHVVEEIEDAGLSELTAVRSYLRLMLKHLLKVQGWSDSPAVDRWRREIVSFQSHAVQRYTPSMSRCIDLTALHARALNELADTKLDEKSPGPWPPACLVSLEELLKADRRLLAALFAAASKLDRFQADWKAWNRSRRLFSRATLSARLFQSG